MYVKLHEGFQDEEIVRVLESLENLLNIMVKEASPVVFSLVL